ncbi:hypothetical protein KM043_012214 [Ampulex compressa]|nr:hypothetical protein KM043_012214 [Ampulex compressa]
MTNVPGERSELRFFPTGLGHFWRDTRAMRICRFGSYFRKSEGQTKRPGCVTPKAKEAEEKNRRAEQVRGCLRSALLGQGRTFVRDRIEGKEEGKRNQSQAGNCLQWSRTTRATGGRNVRDREDSISKIRRGPRVAPTEL